VDIDNIIVTYNSNLEFIYILCFQFTPWATEHGEFKIYGYCL
jgi:hypothetical protein